MLNEEIKEMTLDEIELQIAMNRWLQLDNPYDGLTSAEIGQWNRAQMFGENDEAFPDLDEWSAIVD
jgi:hypothetical protein